MTEAYRSMTHQDIFLSQHKKSMLLTCFHMHGSTAHLHDSMRHAFNSILAQCFVSTGGGREEFLQINLHKENTERGDGDSAVFSIVIYGPVIV